MASTLGGDDPLHDLDDDEKDQQERELRKKARAKGTQPKERNRLPNRANEISRPKVEAGAPGSGLGRTPSMERVIHVASTRPLRKTYQRLLTSDWRKATLGDVLELLWKEIDAPQWPIDATLREVLNPHRHGLPESGFDREVIDEIRHFRRHFRSDLIPSVPDDFPNRRRRRRHAQAETTWTYLILNNLARLQGDTGFFADSQSLLFLLAIDFLLPELADLEFLKATKSNVTVGSMHALGKRAHPSEFPGIRLWVSKSVVIAIEWTPDDTVLSFDVAEVRSRPESLIVTLRRWLGL